jgi:hypothetical protein
VTANVLMYRSSDGWQTFTHVHTFGAAEAATVLAHVAANLIDITPS